MEPCESSADSPTIPDGDSAPISAQPATVLHRIRLGPPWARVESPEHTIHVRRFGCPRTHEPATTYHIVGVCDGLLQVVVNEQVVPVEQGADSRFAIDLTGHLQPRNELKLITLAQALPGQIALEIRSA